MRKFPDLMTMLHMSGFSVIIRDLMRLEWIEREMEKMFSIWQSSQYVYIQMVYFAFKKTNKKKPCYLGCNWLHTLFPNTKIPLSKLKPTQRAALNLLKFLGLSITIESLQPINCHFVITWLCPLIYFPGQNY